METYKTMPDVVRGTALRLASALQEASREAEALARDAGDPEQSSFLLRKVTGLMIKARYLRKMLRLELS